MKLNFIIVCEKVETISKGGKANFYGVFDTIYADRFPATHKEMSIVVNIEKEGGKHQEFFQIKKDNKIMGTGTMIEFNGERPRHQFIHNVESMLLPEEGRYEIEIYIDNKLMGSSYFSAKVTPSGYATS